jgi:hypothetical protein
MRSLGVRYAVAFCEHVRSRNYNTDSCVAARRVGVEPGGKWRWGSRLGLRPKPAVCFIRVRLYTNEKRENDLKKNWKTQIRWGEIPAPAKAGGWHVNATELHQLQYQHNCLNLSKSLLYMRYFHSNSYRYYV